MRRRTRAVRVGDLTIGGSAPVSVQTMGNRDPHDVASCLEQLTACAELGCELFRLTVPDLAAARSLGEIRRKSPVPIVADIHFDFRCALAAIEAGADALRLNPGNIGGRANVQAVARAAKARGVPIRIGVNLGSLEADLDADFREGRLTAPEALCESALRHLKLLGDEGFHDVVISAKASNVADTLTVNRLISEATDCPLHLGVTEAGTLIPGTVRNSVALGILLSEGIGDTIRVSLTDRPEAEVRVGLEVLRSLGLREPGPAVTSCPTCGRTKVDLMRVAAAVEEELEKAFRGRTGRAPRVAVMGCAVNGPGEAKGADVALCGGTNEFVLYVRGQAVGKVRPEDAVRKAVESALHLQ